jgi:hypothetical protein
MTLSDAIESFHRDGARLPARAPGADRPAPRRATAGMRPVADLIGLRRPAAPTWPRLRNGETEGAA